LLDLLGSELNRLAFLNIQLHLTWACVLMVAEKRDGTWLVVEVQNVNSPTDVPARAPEAADIKSPIVVPRGQ
jgi:hypothetical protein